MEFTALKCVFVGSNSTGKTSLLVKLTTGVYPMRHVPATEESYTVDFTLDGKKYNLGLVDTSHKEEQDRTRPLVYPDTDVFVLCYSPGRHNSLSNVQSRWFKEVTHYSLDKPIILLALQADRRQDPATIEMFDRARQGKITTYEEGEDMAKHLNLERYLECSVAKDQGLQDLLKALVEVGTQGKQKKNLKSGKESKRECILM